VPVGLRLRKSGEKAQGVRAVALVRVEADEVVLLPDLVSVRQLQQEVRLLDDVRKFDTPEESS
jgi:hypothetical protein